MTQQLLRVTDSSLILRRGAVPRTQSRPQPKPISEVAQYFVIDLAFHCLTGGLFSSLFTALAVVVLFELICVSSSELFLFNMFSCL